MNIREYNKEDYLEVKKLYMDGRRRELATANLSNVIELEKDRVKFEKFEKGKILVIDIDGEICGFICLNPPEVSLLYVSQKHTGKGYGKKLLEEGIKKLKEEFNDEKICLDLFKDNIKAKSLYRSLGFEVVYDFKRVVSGEEKNLTHMELKVG